jgi:hypothetical protein
LRACSLAVVILVGSGIARAGLPEGRESFERRMLDDDANSVLPAVPAGSGVNPVSIIATKPDQEDRRFQWRPAIVQSTLFLGLQHGFRFATEPGTRAELKGPFFRDYWKSVKGVDGWKDSDPFIVNYVGHPMMGAITGFIQIQNDPGGRLLQVGMNKPYWNSRMRAMLFSAAYSTIFELGPVSEASLGNVGLDRRTSGMVDLVVTPTIGLGWLVTEDVIDRYVIKFVERKTANRSIRILVRTFANPARAFTNVLRFEAPWHRDGAGGIWRQTYHQTLR